MKMAAAGGRLDVLIRDYLLYRGFTTTLKSFEADLKSDRDKSFRSDKIVDHLYSFVAVYDLDGLKNYWKHLDKRIFARLEYTYNSTVRRLELSLLRLYVIHAVQNGRNDKVSEFFDKMAAELQMQPEWKEWFVLPFIKNPEQNQTFELYFTKMWQETLTISLQNFFSIIFQSMPLPVLLSFVEEQEKRRELEEDNKQLKQQISVLKRIDMEQSQTDPVVVFGTIKEINEDFADIPKENMSKEYQPKSNIVQKLKAPLSAPLQRKKMAAATAATSGNVPINSTAVTMATNNSKLSSSIPTTRKIGANVTALKKDDSGSAQVKLKDSGGKIGKPMQQTFTQQQQQQWTVPKQKPNKLQEHDKIRKELFSKAPINNPSPRQVSNIQSAEYGTTDTGINLSEALEKDGKKSSNQQTQSTMGNVEYAASKRQDDLGTGEPFIILSQDEYIEHHSSITQCRFSSTGTSVASADTDGVVKVWTYSPFTSTSATIMSKSPLLSLEWVTKVERLLLLGSSNGSVKLFDTESKKTLHDVATDSSCPRIISLSCNPSGSHFISSASKATRSSVDVSNSEYLNLSALLRSGNLAYWDLKTMRIQHLLPVESNTACINCTQFNHNGHLMVTGGSDGQIRLFDMHRCECILRWHAHTGEIYCVQFSPDENSVYSMGADGKFINWSAHRPGQKICELTIHAGATGPFVLSGYSGYKQVQTPRGKLFAFDVEGTHILTCATDGGVIYKLPNSTAGLTRTLTLLGHRTPVVSVDWSTAMNCGLCLTGSMDGRIKVTTLLTQ
ncbi:WD repeat-containing protein 91-like [Ptychodera flava]|uniref:WD repeat-containing protein 91-like n=1 Tax=Ptychodera flava TaxID=63121 RepID=UPI003969EEB4